MVDMPFDQILKQLNNPVVAIGLVIMLTNWCKDRMGVNGRLIYAFVFGASVLISALRYVGPYAVGDFVLGDFIWAAFVYGIGATLTWSGMVKPIVHKFKGTVPETVTHARLNNKGIKPLGVRNPSLDSD